MLKAVLKKLAGKSMKEIAAEKAERKKKIDYLYENSNLKRVYFEALTEEELHEQYIDAKVAEEMKNQEKPVVTEELAG